MIQSERSALLLVLLCAVASLATLSRSAAMGATAASLALGASYLLMPRRLRARLGPLLAMIVTLAVVLGVRAWGSRLPI